jgi:hypothetical protein
MCVTTKSRMMKAVDVPRLNACKIQNCEGQNAYQAVHKRTLSLTFPASAVAALELQPRSK